MEPKGNLKFHSFDIRQNKAAVYLDVRLVDEVGEVFEMHSSSFIFELKHVSQLTVEFDRQQEQSVAAHKALDEFDEENKRDPGFLIKGDQTYDFTL